MNKYISEFIPRPCDGLLIHNVSMNRLFRSVHQGNQDWIALIPLTVGWWGGCAEVPAGEAPQADEAGGRQGGWARYPPGEGAPQLRREPRLEE